MSISECKKEALSRLKGNWGKAIGILVAYIVFNFLITIVVGIFENNALLSLVLSIAQMLITVPLAYGLLYTYFKVYNGENVGAFDFVKLGFNNFSKSWKVSLWTVLKMLLPIILFIVIFVVMIVGASFLMVTGNATSPIILIATIVFYIISMIYMISISLYYSLANLIAIDNEEMSAKDAVNTSKEMMKGNRGSLFLLQLSFIGWGILSVFTLGIGLLWLMPYMQLSTVAFYQKLKNNI